MSKPEEPEVGGELRIVPDKVIARLRDPIWQAIGAFLTVLALATSTFVAYDIFIRGARGSSHSAMSIQKQYWYRPLQTSEKQTGKIQVLVDGMPVDFLAVYRWMVSNSGETAIRPSDYIEPINLSIDEPWRLLLVESGYTVPKELQIKWSRVATNTFQMEPALLNSGDSFEALLYLTNPSLSKTETAKLDKMPDVKWGGRIANVKSLTDEPAKPRLTLAKLAFGYTVHHSGVALYSLALVSLLLMLLGLFLAQKSQQIPKLKSQAVLLILFIATMSVGVSEVLTDLAFPSEYSGDVTEQPFVAWFLIVIYGTALMYFAWPMILHRLAPNGDKHGEKGSSPDDLA